MFRVRSAAESMIVLIVVSSWLAVSNHCALGAMGPAQKPTLSECPFHSPNPAKRKDSPGQPCCKILRAVMPVPAKTVARATVDLVDVYLAFANLVFTPPKISSDFATLDTGPPGKTSFTELTGSVRAHAPPFFA